jgi:hypothetical protein
MARCTMSFNEYTVTLTKREFVLVTKALCGKLEYVPRTVSRKGVDIIQDDIEEAKQLGVNLVERRIRCLEEEQDNAIIVLEQALEDSDEGGE